MSSGLMEQLRSYAEEFDAAVAPITLDEVATEATTRRPLRPSTPKRRFPGWAYAAASAAVLLIVATVAVLLGRLGEDALPPTETIPTITETSVAEATSTTTLDTTGTTTSPAEAVVPSGRWWPTMVDLRGEAGVLLLGGSDYHTRLSDLWSFDPEVGWTELSLSAPGDAWFLAYDKETDLVWMMAGVSDGVHGFAEIGTWSPATGEWVRIEAKGGPTGVTDIDPDYRVALDTESRRLVFFASADQSDAWETWAFDIDEHQWTLMNPDISPSGRYGAAMDYDSDSDRVILFGGSVPSAETWAYDFNTDTWTDMKPAESPPPSSHGWMVYDPVTDRMILFGDLVDEATWTYDYNSNTWARLETAVSPSFRKLPGMAHDAETGMVVLHGGTIGYSAGKSDTWLFDPVDETWTEWAPPD